MPPIIQTIYIAWIMKLGWSYGKGQFFLNAFNTIKQHINHKLNAFYYHLSKRVYSNHIIKILFVFSLEANSFFPQNIANGIDGHIMILALNFFSAFSMRIFCNEFLKTGLFSYWLKVKNIQFCGMIYWLSLNKYGGL